MSLKKNFSMGQWSNLAYLGLKPVALTSVNVVKLVFTNCQNKLLPLSLPFGLARMIYPILRQTKFLLHGLI